jgi:serine phosphatase RsbU (regulator of sigma subunit)/CheY-like chemotaxis protein
MDKARILVVEDEELVALAIKTFLERIGYEVPLVTASGEEAIERFPALKPDLVLMDIRLHGKVSGIEAAGFIKDSFQVPVIYLTAYSDPETLERAKMTDPYGYILKPFDERSLQATVQIALHKSAVQNELRRSQEEIATILQSMGDGIIVTAMDGSIEYVNSTAQSLLRLTLPLPTRTALFQMLTIEDARTHEPVQIHPEAVTAKGERISLTNCSLVTEHGRSPALDVNLEPYRDPRGTVRGMMLAFRDAAERSKIQELVDRELQNANDFHKSLLPRDGTEAGGFLMSGFLLAATFGAGDIYNFYPIGTGHLGVYIIDVMGHGIAATSSALLLNRLLVPREGSGRRLPFLQVDPLSPRRVVESLNGFFNSRDNEMFFTICYGVIDLFTKKMRIVRAGHPYPIIQRRGGDIQEVRPGGFAVGVANRIDAPEFEITCAQGDKIFFYSDGLTDSTDAGSTQFSKERLLSIIQETLAIGVKETVARIKREVMAWRGKGSFDDDVSLIAIQYKGSS